MEYKVVAIAPTVKGNEDMKILAQNFEGILKRNAAEGWTYIRTESLKVWVKNSGCFSLFGPPGHYTEKQMIVFRK
jgi:hypothetical protein